VSGECTSLGEYIDWDLIPDSDRIFSKIGFQVGYSKEMQYVPQNKRVVAKVTETLEDEHSKSVIKIQNQVKELKILEQVSEYKFSGAFLVKHSATN